MGSKHVRRFLIIFRNESSWLPVLGIGIAVVAAGVLFKLFYSSGSDEDNKDMLMIRPNRRTASVCEMKCMGWYLRSCDDFKHPLHHVKP